MIGFSITGHSDHGGKGRDIVCAGVSSALMLTVNTITDFIAADAEVNVDPAKEGQASLTLIPPYNKNAEGMIRSFYAHLDSIREDYGQIRLEINKTGQTEKG